jgi:hypothetical protein
MKLTLFYEGGGQSVENTTKVQLLGNGTLVIEDGSDYSRIEVLFDSNCRDKGDIDGFLIEL